MKFINSSLFKMLITIIAFILIIVLLICMFALGIRSGIIQFTTGESVLVRESGRSVACDKDGNVLVLGNFSGPTDFDPSPTEVLGDSVGEDDTFLSKFDGDGNFLWVKTWGGRSPDIVGDVTVDSMGNAYASGNFTSEFDFDPGSGENLIAPAGRHPMYLSRFDPDGAYKWTRTWQNCDVKSLSTDSSIGIDIFGTFNGKVDFDPGPGRVERDANVRDEPYICRLDSNGSFLRVDTGGVDPGSGVAFDNVGNMYVTGTYPKDIGRFAEHTDLDPGPDVFEPELEGVYGAYLVKFNFLGLLIWVKTWGGAAGAQSNDIAIDSANNIFVTGMFAESVDFDPSGGVLERQSKGETDIFVSKFDSDGNLIWVLTWGDTGWDAGHGVEIDTSNNVYVTGMYSISTNESYSVDLDPGPGESLHTPTGDNDIFLNKFDSSGNFIWSKTWGGENIAMAWD